MPDHPLIALVKQSNAIFIIREKPGSISNVATRNRCSPKYSLVVAEITVNTECISIIGSGIRSVKPIDTGVDSTGRKIVRQRVAAVDKTQKRLVNSDTGRVQSFDLVQR